MKTKLIVIAIALSLSSCGKKLEQENLALKSEINDLKLANEELRAGTLSLNTSIETYQVTLKEIDKNLSEISSNQTIVASLTKDIKEGKDVAKTIQQRITAIRALMENSRLKILALDKSLVELRKQSAGKSDEILALDSKLKESSEKLIQKQDEITQMRIALEAEMESLGEALEEQILLAEELKATLNRAYYISADSKTLMEKGVVTKEGGFIGLGKVKMLNANTSDALFTKIEKDQTSSLPINAAKARLISIHPENSYEFTGEGKVETLRIKDAEAFWKDTNYLVIEITK